VFKGVLSRLLHNEKRSRQELSKIANLIRGALKETMSFLYDENEAPDLTTGDADFLAYALKSKSLQSKFRRFTRTPKRKSLHRRAFNPVPVLEVLQLMQLEVLLCKLENKTKTIKTAPRENSEEEIFYYVALVQGTYTYTTSKFRNRFEKQKGGFKKNDRHQKIKEEVFGRARKIKQRFPSYTAHRIAEEISHHFENREGESTDKVTFQTIYKWILKDPSLR